MISKLLVVCLACYSLAAEDVLIDIPLGTLKGSKTNTIAENKPIYSFTGIPYAKPIDTDSKFKVAQPAEAWTGVYDATSSKSGCTSFCMVRKMIVGNDDCLFVDVHTPEPNKDARKAVMVWIHGGGFNMGSGTDPNFFGPDYLVEQDVVVVTFNFRLGAFGFISTQDATAPGNVGLKDQTLLLKWVRDNIQYFGGCPHRVTLFGQSAGGAAVQYHMLTPMSAGLFQNGISQSGSALNPWAISYKPRENAFSLGKSLGIDTSDSEELIKHLSQIPSEKVVEAAMDLDTTQNIFNGRLHAFVPCVEPDVGQEIFLSQNPWELMKSGKIADIPYMAGLNANESLMMAPVVTGMAEMINDHFELFVPEDLNLTDAQERKRIENSLREFYYGDREVTKDTIEEFSQLMMDTMFAAGVQISLEIINNRKSSPSFNYLFTYSSTSNAGIMKSLGLYDGEGGVLHGDEMDYMFFVKVFRSGLKPGSPEEKVTHLISKLWSNFAKTGSPTPTLDDDVTSNWEPIGNEHNYAILDKDLTMEKNMLKERMDLWISMYKDLLGDYIRQ
ncbi:esterase FE4-like [Athalia rosae]|uniref:esterase FE4-like n=1 Tax=Athalia rosae TaxID=37344 RepID=UPI002034694C|nr:esterase FE4-like [Athalia rosae]